MTPNFEDVQSEPIPVPSGTAPSVKAAPAMAGGEGRWPSAARQNLQRPTFTCEIASGCGRTFGGYRAYRDAHTYKRCAAVWELRQRGLHKDGDGVWCRSDPTNSQAVLPGITRHVRTTAEPVSDPDGDELPEGYTDGAKALLRGLMAEGKVR